MIKNIKDELSIWRSMFNVRYLFFFQWRNSHQWAKVCLSSKLQDHTQTHHTRQDSSRRVISPQQRPLLDNTILRQTSMPPAGFEPAITASERPRTHALYHAATGIGCGAFIRNYCSRITLRIYHDRNSCFIVTSKVILGY